MTDLGSPRRLKTLGPSDFTNTFVGWIPKSVRWNSVGVYGRKLMQASNGLITVCVEPDSGAIAALGLCSVPFLAPESLEPAVVPSSSARVAAPMADPGQPLGLTIESEISGVAVRRVFHLQPDAAMLSIETTYVNATARPVSIPIRVAPFASDADVLPVGRNCMAIHRSGAVLVCERDGGAAASAGEMAPDSRVEFSEHYRAARCSGVVTSVSAYGCAHIPLSVVPRGIWARVTGAWGSFVQGDLVLEWRDHRGAPLHAFELAPVGPSGAIALDVEVALPAPARRLALQVRSPGRQETGRLDEAEVANAG